MNSLILSTATRYLMPLLLLFSLFLLLRGHYEPGGGFVGGLVASSGFALCILAFGLEQARRLLWAAPHTWIGVGLSCALLAGLAGPILGEPLLTGVWPGWSLAALGELGSPLLFDIGVYLLVIGVVTLIVFELAEE